MTSKTCHTLCDCRLCLNQCLNHVRWQTSAALGTICLASVPGCQWSPFKAGDKYVSYFHGLAQLIQSLGIFSSLCRCDCLKVRWRSVDNLKKTNKEAELAEQWPRLPVTTMWTRVTWAWNSSLLALLNIHLPASELSNFIDIVQQTNCGLWEVLIHIVWALSMVRELILALD